MLRNKTLFLTKHLKTESNSVSRSRKLSSTTSLVFFLSDCIASTSTNVLLESTIESRKTSSRLFISLIRSKYFSDNDDDTKGIDKNPMLFLIFLAGDGGIVDKNSKRCLKIEIVISIVLLKTLVDA